MPRIRCLLVDADGVTQRTTEGWIDRVVELCPRSDLRDSFLEDLFGEEKSSLVGDSSFESALSAVLSRYQSPTPLSAALELWSELELQESVIKALQEYRSGELMVCLASNQQDYRASVMRTSLGYGDSFDELLLSCELGAVKPSVEFFQYALRRLDVGPEETLLIDDSPANIDAARAIGLGAEQYSFASGVEVLKRMLNKHVRHGA